MKASGPRSASADPPSSMSATDRLMRWAGLSTIASARAGVLVSFGLGLAFAASNAGLSLKALGSTGLEGAATTLLLPVALAWAAVALAIWIGVRKRPFPAIPFIGITLVSSIALRWFYSANIDPEWISDFARYWQSAVELTGASLPITDPYQQRALPYLYPLVLAFGDAPEVVKFGNIGLLCLIQLAGYDILRRAAGHTAAQCFTILWIAAPEPLYSLTIPTHDLSGLVLVAAAAWLVAAGLDTATGKQRWRRPVLLGLCGLAAGILLVVLEIQRGFGGLFLTTLVLVTVAWAIIQRGLPGIARARPGALVNLLVIVCCAAPVYLTGINITQATGLSRTGEAAEAARLRYSTPHSTSFSNGSYYWMRGFHDAFTHHHMDDLEELRAFRRDLMLSDFAEDPVGRATNAIERLDGLYALGTGMGFYTAGVRDSHPRLLRFLQAYNHAFAFPFAALGLIALWILLARRGIPPIVAILALFAALLSLGMAFFTENQPRYAYPVWFVGSIAIAAALGNRRTWMARGPWWRQVAGAGGIAVQAIAISAAALALAWLAVVATYKPGDGRILAEWEFSAPAVAEQQRRPSTAISDLQRRAPERSFYPLALVLTPSPDQHATPLRATTTVCTQDAERARLEFFVKARNLPAANQASHLTLNVDSTPVWTLTGSGDDEIQLVTIPQVINGPGCIELEFELPINGKGAVTRPMPRVEIFFPRLTR